VNKDNNASIIGTGSAAKVLLISFVRGDTRRYRVLHILEQIYLLGIHGHYIHLTDPLPAEVLKTHWDAVILHRIPLDDHLKRLIKNLDSSGAMIISDYDDLIFEPEMIQHINSPDFADPIRFRLYLQGMNDLRSTLERSKACLASTEFLAARIQQTGKPVWIHRNAFSLEMLRQSEQVRELKRHSQDGSVVLGYASGTPTHNKDFDMIKPVLIEIMRTYPKVRLSLVGPLDAGDGWGELGDRIHRFPRVPWRKLPEVLAGFDINLAPLEMNPFAQSKSEIKWMEAGMVEVPTIASPTEAFRFAIRHGENGWMAQEAVDWREGLSTLVEDETLRNRLGRQAYLDTQRDYHPARRASQLAESLNEISQRLRSQNLFTNGLPTPEVVQQRVEARRSERLWMPANLEREPSQIRLGIYELRNWGIKRLMLSVWVDFRRLVAPVFPFRKK